MPANCLALFVTCLVAMISTTAHAAASTTLLTQANIANGQLSFAAPMQSLAIVSNTTSGLLSFNVIGTPNADCSTKDATGANVKAMPTKGFIAVNATVPARTDGNTNKSILVLSASIYTPDSLANSLFFQIDQATNIRFWDAPISKVPLTGTVSPGAAAPYATLTESCFAVTPGDHTFRLYVRESGAGLLEWNVSMVNSIPAITAVGGCGGSCGWNMPLSLRVNITGLCGPSMFHAGLLRVAGQLCDTLTLRSTTDLECLTRVSPTVDGLVNLTLHVADFSIGAVPFPVTFDPLPASKVLDAGAIAGLSVGTAIAAALVIIAIVLFFRRSSRNNRNAPTNPNEPVCVLFTDIQSSTALWARDPEIMGAALDAHHDIIRRQIAEHGAYEVKTVGDAFMIVVASPVVAAALALDIQEALYAHEWGSDEIDAAYVDFAATLSMRVDSPTGSKQQQSQGYLSPWNGLRVRIGIHYGVVDIKEDEVSKGYDYYGPTVNVAARVESVGHGGQIVVSGEFVDAFMAAGSFSGSVQLATSHSRRDTPKTLELGSHKLRGVSNDVRLAQLLPVESSPISRRRFPPLRLLQDGGMNGSFRDSSSPGMMKLPSLSETASQGATSRGGAPLESSRSQLDAIALTLKTTLAAVPATDRSSMINRLTRAWRMTPQGGRVTEDELIRQLSSQVRRVLSHKGIVVETHQGMGGRRYSLPSTPMHMSGVTTLSARERQRVASTTASAFDTPSSMDDAPRDPPPPARVATTEGSLTMIPFTVES